MIYRNLRGLDDVPERAKLRGSYRYTWSKNQKLMHSMDPVFAELNALNINYRVIKGIATQLSLDFLGARVVGDIDIVVSQNEIDKVREILEDHGFRCNSISACGRHPINAPHEALNFNRGEYHVDVHIAEKKNPRRLLTRMLQCEPDIKAHMGTSIPLPPAPLLLLHSAYHGQLAASDTDLVQAIVDIELLSPQCDPRELSELAKQTRTTSDLWSRGLGNEKLESSTHRKRRIHTKIHTQIHAQSPRLRTALLASALLRDRWRGIGTSTEVLRRFPGRRYRYVLWLSGGQFASVERRFRKYGDGFLTAPSDICAPGSWLAPFSGEQSRLVNGTNMAPSTLDYRFTFRIPANCRTLRLNLASEYLDSVDAFLYANGQPITRIIAGDVGQREVHVRRPAEVVEISIRSSSRVCPACFDGLTDLRVLVDYEVT